jgi:anti-sigma factor RsiW
MDMNKKILRLLYRSVDGELSDKEKLKLSRALEASPQLRREKDRIQQQRASLRQGAASSFRPGFVDRLMHRIHKLESDTNGWEQFYLTLAAFFRRFAVVGALALLLLLSYNLKLGDKLEADEVFFASDAAYEELRQLPLF